MANHVSPVYSVSEGRHYFACRLRHLLTLTALGQPKDNYAADLRRRQVEFVASLLNAGQDRLTYDLRYLSRPDPGLASRGRIEVALLCRMDGATAQEAQGYARYVHHLLHAHFEEYVFDPVPAGEIPPLLVPFSFQHVVAITRRAALERLDSLRSRPRRLSPGFSPSTAGEAATGLPPDAIFHLFPFLPSAPLFTTLFRLFLLAPEPVVVSMRLRPTTLTAAEETFLESQIARCERYSQVSLGSLPEDLSLLQPTLREQAKLYQKYQARLLWGLRSQAGLMTVEIASPKPIPLPIVNALGGLMTEPPGGGQAGSEEATHRYLAGGYDVLREEPGAAMRRAEAFQDLEQVSVPHPAAPQGAGRLLYLFDPTEAWATFRLPASSLEAPPGLDVQGWRTQPPPRHLPQEGLLIGASVHPDAPGQPIRIHAEDRGRHIYIVGQTGTGKTTLLKTMILDDMRAGKGLCVIDPHGDLFKSLLGTLPEARVPDVVVLDPTDIGRPVGLNLLECETDGQRHFLVQELVGILTRLLQDEYGLGSLPGFAGPIFFQHMRMNLLLTMSNRQDPGTLLEFYTIYQEKEYWRRWLPLKMHDPLLERWVSHVLPRTDYTKPGDEGTSMGGYVGSKFEGFVFDPLLRYIFGQKRSTFDLREIMDEGKILLVNLAKGELTEANARFLGMVLLAKLMAAAMGRVTIPEGARREFILYCDEFQSLATESFVTLLSEARKFGLSLVLANQFLSQVRDQRIVQAIFGNVASLICFRLGNADAELLEKEFAPVFSRFDLQNLPNWQAYMRTLIRGQTVRPFSLQTLPDSSSFDDTRAQRVRACSRHRYGRPRTVVDKEIAQSLRCPSDR